MVANVVNWAILAWTLLAFFLAVGIAAHALDELRGRPLGTELPGWLLAGSAALGLGGATVIGIIAATKIGAGLLVFIIVGAFFVLAYDLELFGGVVHTDLGFAVSWGAFPVLTSAYAQTQTLSWAAVVLAASAALSSAAQRNLSNPVRMVRRRVTSVEGEIRFSDGSTRPIDRDFLLVPSERALRALSLAMIGVAVAFVLVRRVH
ncbi:MAG TPA: hypothetical protein VIJ99_02195, partial [Acidimicrobiales bacterium]